MPSPKVQDQDVGVPVDVSVNWTVCPTVGDAGANAKDPVNAGGLVTVTVRDPCFAPALLRTIRVTGYEPAAAYAWVGFCAVDAAPSPNVHCQDVAPPAVVSVNCTASPGPGVAGLKTNVAGPVAGMTVTVRLARFELLPLPATSVILRNPAFV